jgi:hypothetical protein
MRKIVTGRYDNPGESGYAGWVEGTRDDGTSWILFIDENSSPAEFFAQRDESGAILGEAVALQ